MIYWAVLLLGSYGCVSFRKLRADSVLYQVINGLGSCFLVVNTVYYRAFPSAFVNGLDLHCGQRQDSDASQAARQPPVY